MTNKRMKKKLQFQIFQIILLIKIIKFKILNFNKSFKMNYKMKFFKVLMKICLNKKIFIQNKIFKIKNKKRKVKF